MGLDDMAVYASGRHGFPQSSGRTPSAAVVIWAFVTHAALPA